MAERPDKAAVAAAHRTINESDPETAKQVARLKRLHRATGETAERSEAAIDGILESGPGAAARLAATADAVAALYGLKEE